MERKRAVGLQKGGSIPRMREGKPPTAKRRCGCSIYWSFYSRVFSLILEMQMTLKKPLETALGLPRRE